MILGRDNEKSRIRTFIVDGIMSKGNSTSMYICGVPGLGKTACLMEIVKDLIKKYEFSFHYINGLNMGKAGSFYSSMFEEITGKPKIAKDACKYLGKCLFLT